ncbi:hypothetical protein EH222_09440 [candidate division KSB1 bacterium]|nr:MAG: hypothetical protein EH222_09440 [candidate division KSB1 bacterium]
MNRFIAILFAFLFSVPAAVLSQTTIDELHGDELYSYRNWHSGNQFRTTVYNDGFVGHRNSIHPDDIGEWPINSGHNYVNLITYFLLAEVKDTNGIITHISSESNGIHTGGTGDSSGDTREDGSWQTNAPLPGFANPEFQRIAMSHQEESWPVTWPDKFEDAIDPGWPGAWNGYFGKDILNADQESYYLFDDYQNDEFSFFPDSNDVNRRGLGLRGTVRGFQWSNVLVEDVLFQLVDIKNIGTYNHSKMIFGIVSGPVFGRSVQGGGDGSDDCAQFDLQRKLGWHFDGDDIGDTGWTPVGCQGFSYFESPGNPYDGIDDDDDALGGPGKVITEELFAPRVINVGDPIVLINYTTFERTVTTMPAAGVDIVYLENVYHYNAGDVFEEIESNLIDDNLNGIIDESNGYSYGTEPNLVKNYLFVGRKYIDYFTDDGKDNLLIDERRDDGIDNNNDWNAASDDVGLDGVANTGDFGEGDGRPTSGWQPAGAIPGLTGAPNKYGLYDTYLPGEPRVDKTDINESDMIGLTAFNIYIWNNPTFTDDEGMWNGFTPGLLNDYGQLSDTDLMLGSGYFPLSTGNIERFSLGIMFGINQDDLFTNNDYAKKTYEENYNFAKAPIIPTLELIPGDNMVTLIWDDAAEYSADPISGLDFEGYRIYRSTDPGWNDMLPITDGQGTTAYRKPLAQFDLADGETGYHPIHVRGVEFYLGNDTGIVHSFVDSTARNGQTYYYAVTAYDRGDAALGIAPSECSKYIAVALDGSVERGRNVGIAKPEAPVLGFKEANIAQLTLVDGGTATGAVGYEIVNPTLIKENVTYQVVFEDSVVSNDAGRQVMGTKNFSLLNAQTGQVLIDKSTSLARDVEHPITDGFVIKLINASALDVWADSSYWMNGSDDSLLHTYTFQPYRYSRTNGTGLAHDYLIEFGEVGVGMSTEFVASATRIYPVKETNFTVTNLTTGEPVAYGFNDQDFVAGEEGKFTAFTDRSRTDEIILMEPNAQDSLIVTWALTLTAPTDGLDSLYRNAKAGDKLQIKTTKPFLSNDVYEFTTAARQVDVEMAKAQMDLIKVVPNPYVVSNSWEPLNPYTTGRGPRELHFIHLPQKCTIRIFSIRGQLVQEIEHNSADISDGTYVWNMLTKDLLDIAYGIYIYHVDAGELGEKTGKFAIVK